MLKKYLSISVATMLIVIAGCKKSEEISTTEELKTSNEISALSSTSIIPGDTKPTSTTNEMINYESYFVSKADGKIHGYIISIPKDYNPYKGKEYPLLVFMHGSGEKPYSDYETSKLKIHGPHREIFNANRGFDAVIASIQMAKYEDEVNPKVIKEFIDVLSGTDVSPNKSQGAIGFGKYDIDLDRIHLTGLSLGGNGVFRTAYSYPDMFASISEFAGYTGPQSEMQKIKMPAYIRHSKYDGIVSSYNALNALNWLSSIGNSSIDYEIFESYNHDSWTSEYTRTDNKSVYEWHWKIKKKGGNSSKPNPEQPVVEKPQSPANGNSSLSINSFSPAVNGVINASNLSALSLQFNKPVKAGKGIIEVKNLTDNETFKVFANWSMVSVLNDKATIYPINLKAGKSYSVKIESGVFTDMSGNNFDGISNDYTWKFSVSGTATTTPSANNGDNNNWNGLSVNSYYPTMNSTVKRPSNGFLPLTIDFNKNIKRGSGVIKIKNLTDNTSFDIQANWGMVNVGNNKVGIYPIAVSGGKKYAVTIQEGTFLDESGNKFNGITDNSWTFNVTW